MHRQHYRFWVALFFAACVLVMLAACSGSPSAEDAGPVDDCGPYEPTEQDVEKTLEFGAKIFAPGEWIRSYTVEPYKISLTRRNDPQKSLEYVEYLIFTCGYGQSELDSYFGDEGFKVIFSDYESYAATNFCEITSLTLYEYDLVDEGNPLLARYWVKQDSDTRILVNMLVVPETARASLDDYSRQLFPELPACP